jgi:cytidine deaminase
MDDRELVDRALEAAVCAFAPYSGLKVGACVVTESGEVFAGCNIENASYGLTVCAERVAIFAAVAAGHKGIETLAVASRDMETAMPCGACLQVMNEFGVKRVLVGKAAGTFESFSLSDLLPRPFELRGR